MYKVVIDANVWIRFARAKNIEPLVQRILKYQLVPVINNYLLAEVFDVIDDNKWMNENQAFKLLNLISSL